MVKKETSKKMKKNSKNNEVFKDNKQIIIAIILVVVLIVCIFLSIKTVVNYNKRNNNNSQNDIVKNVNILKDASIGSLKITNVEIGLNEGVSTYRAIVMNTANTDYHIKTLNIVFTENQQEQKIPALVNLTIKAGTSQVIELVLDHDITQTDKISYMVE